MSGRAEPATEVVWVSDALLGPDLRHERGVAVTIADGRIASIATGAAEESLPRRLLMPALVNAHDHARPSLISFGSAFLPLELWLPRAALATPPDPYLAAVGPLARSARSGAAAVMVHYTRPSGAMPIVAEAREVARAARDVGVHVAFALAVRDRNPLVYGPSDEILDALPAGAARQVEALFMRPGPSPRAYLDLTDEIAAAIEGPGVSVQFGPAGPQWCSSGLLEAIAARSAETGRRVHMHLLETRYQREWADRAFPDGLVAHLDRIGLLSPRLTVAHALYATEAEREVLAQAGVAIATCFGSNLHTRAGIAPIAAARRQGCRVCVGLDGLALDDDDDLLRETRLAMLVHGRWGFDDPGDRRAFLAATIAAGRASLGRAGTGAIEPGALADLLVLDLDALDRDALLPVDPLDLVLARGTAAHVREVYAAGRRIVAEGRVTGIDLPAAERALREQFRAALPRSPLLAAWEPFAAAVRDWYGDRAGCG